MHEETPSAGLEMSVRSPACNVLSLQRLEDDGAIALKLVPDHSQASPRTLLQARANGMGETKS